MSQSSVRLIIVPWLIPGWAQAQVWGNFILIRRGIKVTEQLLAHELAHVRQWQTLGIIPFMFLYVKYFLKHGYHDHPLELEAQAAAHHDYYRQWARQILHPEKSLFPSLRKKLT
jgi:hypothetical protein